MYVKWGGDGFDFNQSHFLVFDNNFSLVEDKAMSVGEKSVVTIQKNRVTYCNIGVALKDSSQSLVSQNVFKNNSVAISYFTKKPWYGMPYFTLKGNLYAHNGKKEENRGFYRYFKTSLP